MYGLELPEHEGFEDPNWIPYLEFQDRTGDELLERVNKFVEPRSNSPVLRLWDYDRVGRGELQRRFYRKGPEWAFQGGDQARWAMARNPGRPFSSTSAAHLDYPWRQATETAACHKLRFAQQMGTGAHLDLYLMGPISAQDDQTWLPEVSNLFKWREAHKVYYAGLTPSANVAIYSSYNQSRYGSYSGGFVHSSDVYRGVYKALVDSRIPFWMVNDLRIADGTTKLDDYKAIVMPNVEAISDKEIAALDDYVKKGGVLVATGRTGLSDERARPRKQIDFKSFPGAAYGEPVDAHGWTANLDTADLQIGEGRMAINGSYFPMALRRGAKTLMPLAPEQRFGPPELTYAIPGDEPRSEPVVVTRKYGKGRVVHLPWDPGAVYYRNGLVTHRDLFSVIIDRFAPPARSYRLAGDGPVELMVMRQPSTGRDLVHVINYAGQRDGLYLDPPAIHGLKLGTRRPNVEAVELVSGEALLRTDASDDGYTWFELPPVGTFAAVSIG